MTALLLWSLLALGAPDGVRHIKATPCDVVDIRLSLGMSTLLQFDLAPSLSFHADEKHFDIRSTDSAKRVLAIIPKISSGELEKILGSHETASPGFIAKRLDEYFRTNLFVFFKDSSRLIFRLRFTSKDKADYVVHIQQIFKEGCVL